MRPQELSVRLRVRGRRACMRVSVRVCVCVFGRRVCVSACLPSASCRDYITVCLEKHRRVSAVHMLGELKKKKKSKTKKKKRSPEHLLPFGMKVCLTVDPLLALCGEREGTEKVQPFVWVLGRNGKGKLRSCSRRHNKKTDVSSFSNSRSALSGFCSQDSNMLPFLGVIRSKEDGRPTLSRFLLEVSSC